MPWPDEATLAACIRGAGVHGAADNIDEGSARANILPLAEPCAAAARFRNRTVLLALPSSLATIAALIQLDGLARRLILWPRDGAAPHMSEIARRAGVEDTITEWPPSEALTKPPPVAGSVGVRPAREPTEWVLLTSGTTGLPKLVVHTLQTLAGHIRRADGKAPVWCTFYDIRRYGGLQIALRALVGGGSLILPEAGEAMPAFLDRAAASGASHFLGTPSHWRLALMAGAPARIAPRYVRLSGEVADQAILDLLSEAFPDAALVHAFASTEAGLAFEIADRRAGFSATLLEQGAIADLRVVGETLHIRSPRCALGLLNGTVEALPRADGFVDTGDAVSRHADRYVFAGRRDGVVNVGGQKVYPEEVEAVLNLHPAVQMSLVSARRSPITGAIVSADIVRRPGIGPEALAAELRMFCSARLPRHKVPVSIRIVPSLAMAASGKLVRPRA